LKNLLPIFLLCLLISCTNDDKSIDRTNKPLDTIPLINDDTSILIKRDTAINKIKLDSSTIIKENSNHDVIAKRNYQLPKPLDVNGITYKTILKRIKEEGWGKPVGGTGGGWSEWLYKETFRPIGWSKDGKFAFIINGAGEVEYLKLIIVNSKTNKIICKIKEVDYELNNFWNNDYEKIEKVLTENKIIQQYDFQLDIESPPQIKLKDHPVEKRTLKVLKGSIGILQNPFESNAVTIDYYFWHEGARGEGGTEFDVNGINKLDKTK